MKVTQNKPRIKVTYYQFEDANISFTQLQKLTAIQSSSRDSNYQYSESQEIIIDFFRKQLKTVSFEQILTEFSNFFLYYNEQVNSELQAAIYPILVYNQEQEYQNTIKRTCYLLIEYLLSNNQAQDISKILQIFTQKKINETTDMYAQQTIKAWARNFILSQEFKILKYFEPKYRSQVPQKWSDRYLILRLIKQSNLDNCSEEQIKVTKTLVRQLKQQFNFKLTMYIARCQWSNNSQNLGENPTFLSKNALSIIKKVVIKRQTFNNKSIANLFIQQTQGLCYREFKQIMLKYLGIEHNSKSTQWFYEHIVAFLTKLHRQEDEQIWNSRMLQQTCQDLIGYFTNYQNLQNQTHPLHGLFAKQDYLTLTNILLKIILIDEDNYSYLINNLVALIENYDNQPQSQAKWLIGFLETFQVVFTLGFENLSHNWI